MPFFLGLDVSTTATKALLMSEEGKVLAVAAHEYTYETPRPLWSEQHPDLWWDGTSESITKVIKESGISPDEVVAIGLTGQMHGLVLLDEHGQVLRPAILWNDQRTSMQCDEIRSRLGKARLIQITGNNALTGFTAPKILWVQQKEPDIWARTRHILLPKDYVRYKLSDGFAMDKADGSGTLLFDLNARTWSADMLTALEIPSEYLPDTYEGPEVSSYLSPHVATELGLTPGLPIVGGGGDQAAQAVGVGAVQPGIIALTLGTSGVVFATTETPLIEPEGRLHAFCHALPDRWHFMGVMLSAAGSLQWYRDTLAPGESFDSLLAPAQDVSPGCEGLFFLPYLTGERTPHADPLARGGFIGLTIRHGKAHMTRAVLEGVAFGLKDSFTLIQNAGLGSIKQVRVSGGGTKSGLWLQIIADVLGVELVIVNTTEGAALGAALLAGVGAGMWPNVNIACEQAVHITGRTAPSPHTGVYEKVYPLYQNLYPALKDEFKKLSKIEGE
jgi:xylulokinase